MPNKYISVFSPPYLLTIYISENTLFMPLSQIALHIQPATWHISEHQFSISSRNPAKRPPMAIPIQEFIVIANLYAVAIIASDETYMPHPARTSHTQTDPIAIITSTQTTQPAKDDTWASTTHPYTDALGEESMPCTSWICPHTEWLGFAVSLTYIVFRIKNKTSHSHI